MGRDETLIDNQHFERKLIEKGVRYIAGVDEVGRGCLAGPVYASAVILKIPSDIEGITDSKKIAVKKRERICGVIKERALAFGIGMVEPEEIDRINIVNATLKAMKLAVETLSIRPEYLLIDGAQKIPVEIPQVAIVKGDSLSISIGAASIVAKVARDAMMSSMEDDFFGFTFSSHKGYGTAAHLEEIRQHGPTPIHRKTFHGVCS